VFVYVGNVTIVGVIEGGNQTIVCVGIGVSVACGVAVGSAAFKGRQAIRRKSSPKRKNILIALIRQT
jgi:hypothetical protein